MKVTYVLNYQPSQTSGKELAAFEKITAMKEVFTDVRVVYPKGENGFSLLLSFAANEFQLLRLLRRNPSDFLICRGVGGIFASLFFPNLVVREIHADLDEELRILNKTSIKYFMLRRLNKFLQMRCVAHIYNNPLLVEFFKAKGFLGHSYVAYNGVNASEAKKRAYESNYHAPCKNYVVFTGSCSVWHDMQMVEELAKKLRAHGIETIVAGGRFTSPNTINISPCSNSNCLSLVKNSLGALIFINNVRVSPGNALKTYEYMALGRPVLANEALMGYSDELADYDGALLLDPAISNSSKIARFLLENADSQFFRARPYSWVHRMEGWHDFLRKIK